MRMVSLSRERSFSIGSESRLGDRRDCWNGGTHVSDFEWDTDSGTWNGKDSSGEYVWMDVFVKKSGKWQAVASQSTKVAK